MQTNNGGALVIVAIAAVVIYFIFCPSRPSKTIEADDTLIRSVIFFRHGHRSPLITYPNDPHPFSDKKKWTSGPGSLTKKGKQESYALGKLLRRRYKYFLPDEYHTVDVITYSTNKERTYNTAALLLAGLYPPTLEELWSEKLPWHPIPVYGDVIFNSSIGIHCPRYIEEIQIAFAKENKTFLAENSELIDYLKKHTGFNLQPDILLSTFGITDCLLMQNMSGLELPVWSKEVLPSKLMPFITKLYNAMVSNSDVQIQLGGGVMLKRILDIFKMGRRKLYLHCGHDVTQMMLLAALGVPKPIDIPNPTSSIIVELHQISHSKVVKAYYLNHSSSEHFEPIPLNCGKHQCLLNEFEAMYTDINTQDYQEVCNNAEKKSDYISDIIQSLAFGGVPKF